MNFKELGDKQLLDTITYKSNVLESLWKKIEPLMEEFTSSKIEFKDMVDEMHKRGVKYGEQD